MAWNPRLSGRDRLYAALCVILGTVWFSFGCSPATIGFLLAPWVDDKTPAACKLSSKDKEVTVALMCNFTKPITHHEIMAADQDLAERLALSMAKSFKENKEKVKFVPLSQVRSYQNKMAAGGPVSEKEIGQHFKADYVLVLEINSMSLYEHGSSRGLFHGRSEIGVRVLDVSKPTGEGQIFDQVYITEYPKHGPVDAGSSSALQFRGKFLNKVARELTQWFSAYPSDQRFDTMMD